MRITLFALLVAMFMALLGMFVPSPAHARGIPTQVEAAAADALLSDIEECARDKKWDCVEAKYDELRRMRLDSINPSATWCAAFASEARGDIALTFERLNLIFVSFPSYENKKLGDLEFTSVKTWLQFMDANFAPVKFRLPFVLYASRPREIEGTSSAALTFANQQLKSTRRFKGYLPKGQYSFGGNTIIVGDSGVVADEELAAEPVVKTTRKLDMHVLGGPGLRFDEPLQPVNVGPSFVVNIRPQPSWWNKPKPGWTFGYQLWLDARNFGTYHPGVSWGMGGVVGNDWTKTTPAGEFTFMLDVGLMLGTGVHSTTCQYNTQAASADQVDMTCGYGEGVLPMLTTQARLPGSFYNVFSGGTLQALARLDVKNSGWYVGGGVWLLGQVFILPGQQMEGLEARVILADGREVTIPYHWSGSPFAFGGQVVPGIMVGRSLP